MVTPTAKIDSYNRMQFNTTHSKYPLSRLGTISNGHVFLSVHNVIKTGLENIHTHLKDPPLHDLGNFLGYCGVWAHTLDLHHDTEGNSPRISNHDYDSSSV